MTLHKHMGYDPDIEGAAKTLGGRRHMIETGQTLRKVFPGKPIWVTEWSVACGDNALSVLAMADVYLGFFEHPELFAIADYFQINASNKLINYDKATGTHTRTSFGAAYQVVRDIFEGGEILARTIDSSKIGEGLDAVSAEAVMKDGKLVVFAINKTTSIAYLDLSIDGVANSHPLVHRALAFEHVNQYNEYAMDDNLLTEIEVKNGQIAVPPLSINQIKASKE